MVIHFEKLSKAIDVFNSNRIEYEQVTYAEIIKDIKDPLDELAVLKIIEELYSDSF